MASLELKFTMEWTKQALDIAYPEVKDAGWEWRCGGARPLAVRTDFDGDAGKGNWHVWVDECDTVCSMYDPPTAIALAVILASRGDLKP